LLASVFLNDQGILAIYLHLVSKLEGMNMKIAFLHTPNFFTSELLKGFVQHWHTMK